MKPSLQLNPELCLQQFRDGFGTVSPGGKAGNMKAPSLRLIRFDDAWRPLAQEALLEGNGSSHVTATFQEIYGGRNAHGKPADIHFPKFWPAALDASPYAGDIHVHSPMHFDGAVTVRPVTTDRATGLEFAITIRDRRTPGELYPQNVIRMPVGIEVPLSHGTRVYGTVDLFHHAAEEYHCELQDPRFPRAWHYLEAELFGLYQTPLVATENHDPARLPDRVHGGAPLACFSEDGRLWWGVAGESEYGSTTLWHDSRVRHFTTLYLKPGGSASWKFVLWRHLTRHPSDLLLDCTRAKGFFDILNPVDFVRQGAPEGPILFGNVSRVKFQLDELKKLRPALVFLNYHYDHISSTANLYGEWKTYEGFSYSEKELKELIANIHALGAKVGVYGTQVEQPDSHKAVKEEDIVLDAWGRRWHAWEPGNWVVDGGNRGCAERLARAEAEFCKHYGLDAVFVDRLDHMGVNANPVRVGDNERLELVPSIRLGMIHLNRKRMEWQRKLNPDLLVSLNNTTCWAGVRHSDFNNLEGGDEFPRAYQPFLYQPHGVIHLQHFGCLFGTFEELNLFQAVGGGERKSSFIEKIHKLLRRSLFSGVEAQPYGDEYFVDRKSMFYAEGRDKDQPDEEKYRVLQSIPYHGGAEWRVLREKIQPALAAARRLTIPVARVWGEPDVGDVPPKCQFFARAGDQGGLYVGLQNDGPDPVSVVLTVEGRMFSGTVPPDSTRVWWFDPASGKTESLVFEGFRERVSS